MHRHRNEGAGTTFRRLEWRFVRILGLKADSEAPESPIKRKLARVSEYEYSEFREQVPRWGNPSVGAAFWHSYEVQESVNTSVAPRLVSPRNTTSFRSPHDYVIVPPQSNSDSSSYARSDDSRFLQQVIPSFSSNTRWFLFQTIPAYRHSY